MIRMSVVYVLEMDRLVYVMILARMTMVSVMMVASTLDLMSAHMGQTAQIVG